MSVKVQALALYDNDAEDSDELSFKINDLLTVIKEHWQDGWHLCQLGEKRGVAPANYLQILLKPQLKEPKEESIYDSPRNYLNLTKDSHAKYAAAENNTHMQQFEQADYMNIGDLSITEDIYQNTSLLSGDRTPPRTRTQPASGPPRRPTPELPAKQNSKVSYPTEIPRYDLEKPGLEHQTSEYIDMDGAKKALTTQNSDYMDMVEADGDLDYDEIDYDVVPDEPAHHIQSSNDSVESSNFKSSSQIYPLSPVYRSSDSGKVSMDSAKSSASSLPYHQGQPALPDKSSKSSVRSLPHNAEDEDYMVPPSLHEKKPQDHDYFNPPSPEPTSTPSHKQANKVSESLAASDVVVLEDNVEYASGEQIQDMIHHRKYSSPTLEKKKKKSAGTVEQFFNTLTMKKNKSGATQQKSPDTSTLKRSKNISKSLELVDEPSSDVVNRPLPPPPGVRTAGEVSSVVGDRKAINYKVRPLPVPPSPLNTRALLSPHEQQDYVEISDLDVVPPKMPDSRQSRITLDRQRSSSVTTPPFSSCNTTPVGGRRHSSPNRANITYPINAGPVIEDEYDDDDDEMHDYQEVPDLPDIISHHVSYNDHTTHGNHSNYHSSQSLSSTESCGSSGGYPSLPASYPRPPLPASAAPPPPSAATLPSSAPTSRTSPPHGKTNNKRYNKPSQLPLHTQTQPTPRTPSVYSPTTLAKLPAARQSLPDNHPQHSPEMGIPQSYYGMYDSVSEAGSGGEGDKSPDLPELDVSLLTPHDRQLIHVHCGVISTSLLRTATECLIRLKRVTDTRQHELYVDLCKETAGSIIEIVKHLTALGERSNTPLLNLHTTHQSTRLKNILKELIEAIKVAKIQFPALIPHNQMLTKRNELITCVRAVKEFVVVLLRKP